MAARDVTSQLTRDQPKKQYVQMIDTSFKFNLTRI